MQKIKVLLSAFAVVAIVSSALAFKESNYFASGSVFCNSSCPANQQIAFMIDPNGLNTAPCGLGVQPYVISVCGGSVSCVATPSGTKFRATTDQGN